MARAVVDKIEDVPEALRTEYEPGPGGRFILKIEGLDPELDHPAVKPLRAAKLHEKTAREKAEADAKKLAADMEALRAEMTKRLEEANPASQIDGLRKSYEEREAQNIAKAVGPKEAEIKRLSEAMRKVMIHDKATVIAMACAADPMSVDLYLPELQRRLVVEYDANGDPQTRVLDRTGQPSALTLDGLKEEIMQDPRFKPLNKGSQATGGGAVSASGGGGATGAQKPNFLTSSPAEIDAWMERNNHQRS